MIFFTYKPLFQHFKICYKSWVNPPPHPPLMDLCVQLMTKLKSCINLFYRVIFLRKYFRTEWYSVDQYFRYAVTFLSEKSYCSV